MASHRPSLLGSLTRGTLAGLAGSGLVSLFQENGTDRDAPEWASHLLVGTQWGLAHALAARRGLHGIRSIGVVFASVYGADLAVSTALGVLHPGEWSEQDWAEDIVDKLVIATATGLVFHLLLAPRRHRKDRAEEERPRRHQGHRYSGPVASGPTPTTSWGH